MQGGNDQSRALQGWEAGLGEQMIAFSGIEGDVMLERYLSLGDQHVEILYVEGERRFAEEAFSALSRALRLVTGYFDLPGLYPKCRAVLVPDRSEYDRLVRDLLHVEIEVPSNPARIAQCQRTDMVILSPSAYESHSIYVYIPDEFKRLLAHELTHVVEEYLSPDMEASPRWWSEGLAISLSEQWRYEDEFRKPVLEGVSQSRIPRIREIETDRRLAYEWGWTIVRFIESAYGKEMILRVVKECADGDVFSIIGDDVDTLENRWRDWLLQGGVWAGDCTDF